MIPAAAAAMLSAAAGAAVAWWAHRRTRLSPWNAYLSWGACVALTVGAAALQAPVALALATGALIAATTAAVLARRWHVAALGAGGELRDHERARDGVDHVA